MQRSQREEGMKDKENSQEDYGEWMVVSRRKSHKNTKPVQNYPEKKLSVEEPLSQMSLASTAKPFVAGQNSKNGKRKVLHTQSVVSQKETNVMATSSISKSKMGKSAKDKGMHASLNQKRTSLVGMQSFEAGPSSKDGLFVFGAETHQGPFGLSSSLSPKTQPSKTHFSKERTSSASEHSSSNDGRQRKVGDLLQGKNHSGE